MLMLSNTSSFIKHYKSIMKAAHINCTLFPKSFEGTPKKCNNNNTKNVKTEE